MNKVVTKIITMLLRRIFILLFYIICSQKQAHYLLKLKNMLAAIYINREKPASQKTYGTLTKYLKKAGHSFYAINYKQDDWQLQDNTDIILCVGGDGTILRAARGAAQAGIEILGINCGNLGFLSSVDGQGKLSALDDILKGKCIKQKCMLLCIEVKRSGKTVFKSSALNDCVIKTAESRAAYLNASFDGEALKDYFGDGLIIATPTGSTAYGLAAGGPISYPALDIILLTPICPHTLNQRPLVLPANKMLEIQTSSKRNAKFTLSADGQINFPLEQGDIVRITKNKKSAQIIMPSDYNFFKVLTSKLKWGSR